MNCASAPVGYWRLPSQSVETMDRSPLILGHDEQTIPLNDNLTFVKTGLLGFVSANKLWILGHLEDQIRYLDSSGSVSHYFARDLTATTMTHAPEVDFW